MSIEWREPEPTKHGPHPKWTAVAEELKANPQQWAMVGVYKRSSASTTAARINRGEIVAFSPVRSFEACARAIGDDQYELFARYVGNGHAPESK